MTEREKGRIYWRNQGGEPRAYADFRDYSDVGGGQEALIPEGGTRATTDEDVAERLAADRLKELQDKRHQAHMTGVPNPSTLEEFGSFHLVQKAKNGASDRWLSVVETHLDRAVTFFGDIGLTRIRPSDVRAWIEELRETDNGRGGTLSEKTVRDHINNLSNLYRRAQSEESVPPGYNPVAALMDKPTPERTEADYLEPHEAALLLESARTFKAREDDGAIGFVYSLIATFLLTGGRKSEVLGLRVEDVDFGRATVRIRPNEHRSLKTEKSKRTVPLWPQLRTILEEYLEGPGPEKGLLFPSPRTGKVLTDVRKQLDAVATREDVDDLELGFSEGEIRCHRFRHTYTSARIQTYEVVKRAGQETVVPVELYRVARELGHSSTKLIEQRYGHLLANRQARSDEVAFRPEEHMDRIREKVRALREHARSNDDSNSAGRQTASPATE